MAHHRKTIAAIEKYERPELRQLRHPRVFRECRLRTVTGLSRCGSGSAAIPNSEIRDYHLGQFSVIVSTTPTTSLLGIINR